MSRKPITTPRALAFMLYMRGIKPYLIARAMTHACTNAVNFTRCSKSHLAQVWSESQHDSTSHYRFAPGTTLETLRASALSQWPTMAKPQATTPEPLSS